MRVLEAPPDSVSVHHLLRGVPRKGYNPHDDLLTTSHALARLRRFTRLSQTFFNTPRRVHFVGIGGIGMSALAFALAARGHAVSGSDANESAMLARLRDAGVTTVVGHSADNLRVLEAPAEAIVFSSAIFADNPERRAAAQMDIPQWHRAQLLAYFVNSAKVSIAVSGTHGKSTTSAMIAHILDKRGLNPTALLGAEYPPFGSNARIGDPDLVVVEADESDGSFTLLKPSIAVVTNVEPEHLENYNDSEAELWRAFKMFVAQAREHVVLNAEGGNLVQSSAPRKRSPRRRSPTAPTPRATLHYGLHRLRRASAPCITRCTASATTMRPAMTIVACAATFKSRRPVCTT
jgi:UDP-N-acetylmuramate-alanine ligase